MPSSCQLEVSGPPGSPLCFLLRGPGAVKREALKGCAQTPTGHLNFPGPVSRHPPEETITEGGLDLQQSEVAVGSTAPALLPLPGQRQHPTGSQVVGGEPSHQPISAAQQPSACPIREPRDMRAGLDPGRWEAAPQGRSPVSFSSPVLGAGFPQTLFSLYQLLGERIERPPISCPPPLSRTRPDAVFTFHHPSVPLSV